MSIDVVLKQKLFGNKTMPIEIILGDKLAFGSYSTEGLEVGKITDSEIIVFDISNMARGFTVVWNPNEKKHIIFSLPLPSTTKEITDFYACVERCAKFWNAKIEVDGAKMSLEEVKSGLDFYIKSNKANIKHFCEDIIEKNSSLTFPTVRFPLTVGKTEAEIFANDPNKFGEWLHEKQNTAAAGPDARFYENEGEIGAYYTVINGVSLILPYVPKVPFGARNPFTDGPLECERWSVVIGIQGEEPLAEMDYPEFVEKIPKEKFERFDDDKFLVKALTEDEIKTIAGI